MPVGGGNSLGWTEVTSPESVPTRRTSRPYPSCPHEGYAKDRLTSMPYRAPLDRLLAPVLEELLAAGGYLDGAKIRECVTATLSAVGQLGSHASRPTVSLGRATRLSVVD